MKIDNLISELTSYSLSHGLIDALDSAYAVSRLMEVLSVSDYCPDDVTEPRELCEILSDICDFAYESGLIESNTVVYRDLFDTKVMGALMPRPSEVVAKFESLYDKIPEENLVELGKVPARYYSEILLHLTKATASSTEKEDPGITFMLPS